VERVSAVKKFINQRMERETVPKNGNISKNTEIGQTMRLSQVNIQRKPASRMSH
jgi:hypothetical protein